jgi:hypothetical protein
LPDIPKHSVSFTARHEWTIGTEERPADAKNFEYGLHSIKGMMKDLGFSLEHDDAYHVRAGDGGEVIVYAEREVPNIEERTEVVDAIVDALSDWMHRMREATQQLMPDVRPDLTNDRVVRRQIEHFKDLETVMPEITKIIRAAVL